MSFFSDFFEFFVAHFDAIFEAHVAFFDDNNAVFCDINCNFWVMLTLFENIGYKRGMEGHILTTNETKESFDMKKNTI